MKWRKSDLFIWMKVFCVGIFLWKLKFWLSMFESLLIVDKSSGGSNMMADVHIPVASSAQARWC